MNNNLKMSEMLSRYSQLIRIISFLDSQILHNLINKLKYKLLKM